MVCIHGRRLGSVLRRCSDSTLEAPRLCHIPALLHFGPTDDQPVGGQLRPAYAQAPASDAASYLVYRAARVGYRPHNRLDRRERAVVHRRALLHCRPGCGVHLSRAGLRQRDDAGVRGHGASRDRGLVHGRRHRPRNHHGHQPRLCGRVDRDREQRAVHVARRLLRMRSRRGHGPRRAGHRRCGVQRSLHRRAARHRVRLRRVRRLWFRAKVGDGAARHRRLHLGRSRRKLPARAALKQPL
mmetsp:Transcript_33425/g.70331  ORF Transcript_33425/g.70331 Transcript_33425/m.70331 type:complete len:241 (-) Transcript_33425:425-1147(-)